MAKKKVQDHAIHRKDVREEHYEFNRMEQALDKEHMRRVDDMRDKFYGGMDPRRRMEMSEGGMVREDHRAMANLSEAPIHKEYPRAGYYSTPYIDAIVECDDMVRDDNGNIYGG